MKIKNELRGWCPTDDEYAVYEVWIEHKILPYGGGWLDQPARIHELYRKCGLLNELIRLNNSSPEKKG